MNRLIRFVFVLVLCTAFVVPAISAQELSVINLPAPRTTGGMPLMDALMNRQTGRAYATRELPAQELANLLWAAWGFNRPDQNLRTAPSASNRQEMTVYAVTAKGVYRYDAAANTLVPVLAGDFRAATGAQDFVGIAPLNLVYVADLAKMNGDDRSEKIVTASADAGFISQNVYLYCASAGLATVVRGWVDRDALHTAMKLDADHYITYAQTVGYPE